MSNGPPGHLSNTNVYFQPKLYRRNSQEISLLEERCKNPQACLKMDNLPSRQHKYLRKTYRLWVSDLKLLATSVLLCLHRHIIFQVHLSLTRDSSIMTPTRAITPTILPLNFLDLDIQPFLQKGWCIAEPFGRSSCARPCSGLISHCPEIGPFTRFTRFSKPLWGVEACPSFAFLNGCKIVQREWYYTLSSCPRTNKRSEYISFHRSGCDLGTRDCGEKYEEDVRPCWYIVQ